MRGEAGGGRFGAGRGDDDHVQRRPFGRGVEERTQVLSFRHPDDGGVRTGARTLPRVPQRSENRYVQRRLRFVGRCDAHGQLRDLLHQPRAVGSPRQRRGRDCGRPYALYGTVVLERQDQTHLFERRFEDRAGGRRFLRRRSRIGRCVARLAVPPHDGPHGGRGEADGRYDRRREHPHRERRSVRRPCVRADRCRRSGNRRSSRGCRAGRSESVVRCRRSARTRCLRGVQGEGFAGNGGVRCRSHAR